MTWSSWTVVLLQHRDIGTIEVLQLSFCSWTYFEQEKQLAEPNVTHPELKSALGYPGRAYKHHVLAIGPPQFFSWYRICSVCQICHCMHRLAGRRSTAAVDMFARGTAVVLILFSLCDEAQSMLRTQCGVRDCVCVDHRRRKWETSSHSLAFCQFDHD